MIQKNTAKILSQGKMVILFRLNDADIPFHGCAEWSELRRSGGSCYGTSRMQIKIRCVPFLIDQQIGRNVEEILQQSTEEAVSRAPWQQGPKQ